MIEVFAPAKINLTLKVGRPRVDGMHPLESVVMFADVGDSVRAAPADEVTLAMSGPFASALSDEDDNLVLRAARRLQELADVKQGAALALDKQLPVASGIGGGSSDAAATLKALNALWDLHLSPETLQEIGVGLGADVPACLAAKSALITGIGETVRPLELPVLHAVLVNNLAPVATAEVYRIFDHLALGSTLPHETPRWTSAAELIAAAAGLGNDLASAAHACAPELSSVESALRADPRALHVALSGSGGTMFALTETAAAAEALARDLSAAEPGWWVRATQLG